jgi:hypothetical protein
MAHYCALVFPFRKHFFDKITGLLGRGRIDLEMWKVAMPLWRITSKWWRVECVFLRGIMAVESLPA